MCLALIQEANKGNVRAFEAIRDTIGEKPVTEVDHEKDKDLYSSSSSEPDGDIVFRNVNGNPHTPIDPETGEVAFGDSFSDGQDEQSLTKTKITPEQKIASVHIDFDNDNILPELNSDTLERLGATESKKVLLKKFVIDRNFEEHDDLTRDDFEHIIGQALYNEPEVFSANSQKPSYYHLASIVETTSKGKPEIGLVLLDIDAQKDNFEIVHAHYVNKVGLNRSKKRATKKD